MECITRKDRLARSVSRATRRFQTQFNHFPRSWILPYDLKEFQMNFKHQSEASFISKPSHGCQGKGIYLFKNIESAGCQDSESVVQMYISSPYLIDGFKFDLRLYVLITSIHPLRIFVYNDGLARFATRPYDPPSSSNISDTMMHLTNYSINKNSKSFVSCNLNGSKRSVKAILNYLRESRGADINLLWESIYDAVIMTIILAQPELRKAVKPWFPSNSLPRNSTGSQCFEILGFDILLDSNLKPWVLEVNHSPSFSCDSDLDSRIKSGVIGDTLNLIDCQFANGSNSIEKQDEANDENRRGTLFAHEKGFLLRGDSETTVIEVDDEKSNLSSDDSCNADSNTNDALQEYFDTFDPRLLKELTNFENENIGNFERVFPPEDTRKLAHYLHLTREISKLGDQTNAIRARQAFKDEQALIETEKRDFVARWKLKQKSNGINSRFMTKKDAPMVKYAREFKHFVKDKSPQKTFLMKTNNLFENFSI